MNHIGREDIRKTISKINIKGCQATAYNDFLAEASSGFVCIEKTNKKHPCCYSYCSQEPFCQD